ncbi:hypothetical protein B0H19DRAFT_1269207 [Mycena capillaripes]|nr:hypothetical protein B0H19DRAFT_1269207 [Mycena capillaripes]
MFAAFLNHPVFSATPRHANKSNFISFSHPRSPDASNIIRLRVIFESPISPLGSAQKGHSLSPLSLLHPSSTSPSVWRPAPNLSLQLPLLRGIMYVEHDGSTASHTAYIKNQIADVYTLLFSSRQLPYVHAISHFISGVCTLSCASENSFGPGIWMLHKFIFDLPDQPLNFRSKGTFSFASFFSICHHLRTVSNCAVRPVSPPLTL